MFVEGSQRAACFLSESCPPSPTECSSRLASGGGEDEKKDASQSPLNVSLIDRLEVSGGGGCLEREWTGLQVRHCFSLPASAPVQGDRLRCSPSRGSRRRAVASAAGVWAQQAAAGPCPPKYLCIATVLPLHMGAGHQPPETTGPGNKITDPH